MRCTTGTKKYIFSKGCLDHQFSKVQGQIIKLMHYTKVVAQDWSYAELTPKLSCVPGGKTFAKEPAVLLPEQKVHIWADSSTTVS